MFKSSDMKAETVVKVSEEMAVIIRAAKLGPEYHRFCAYYDSITVLDLHNSWIQYIIAVLPTIIPDCRSADG